MIERRISSSPELRVERRGETADPILVGYASVFNEWTTLVNNRYWIYREIVRPGAFAAAIAERQDVRSLFNHDPNFVLGRTLSGTLALRETDRGLLQETRLSSSPMVRDLVITPIERRDITGQSFAFLPRNDGSQTTVEKNNGVVITKRSGERITEYMDGETLRTDRELLSANLFDVTVATYPQYEGTDVALRAAGPVDVAQLEREARERFEGAIRDTSPRRVDPWIVSAEGRLRLAEIV